MMDQNDDRVLATGEHAGYKWLIAHNCMGFRCGYVHVPAGHPWAGKHYDDVNADAHGGLTYCDDEEDGGSWFGFDCAHCDDAMDPSLPDSKGMAKYMGHLSGTIRTQEYVQGECESLCEQAAAAATPATA